MSTPQGHDLLVTQRYTNGTLTIFAANCECGERFRELRLPRLWLRHDAHCAEVKTEMLRRRKS